MMIISILIANNVINTVVNVISKDALIVPLIEYSMVKIVNALLTQFPTQIRLGAQVIFIYIFFFFKDCDVAVVKGMFSDDLTSIIYKFEFPIQFYFPF